jgi:hypothetical protein
MTNKIRIQNVKTGKVSEVTQFAWNTLKKGGKSKFYEVLNNPSLAKFNPKANPKQAVAEEIEDEQPQSSNDEKETPQTPGPDETEWNESAPGKKGRKPKN